MDQLIASDLYRYHGSHGIAGFLTTFLFRPGFRFSYFYRKAASAPKYSPCRIIYFLLHRHYMFKYGFQIPVTTVIGKGLYIGHFGTLIVNKRVRIGDNCNLSPGVTIGQANRGHLEGVPVIGNGVWIGTGAVIVGNITIGNNVLIAPNSFVNSSVPENSIVLGNPSKIIANDRATEGYVNYKAI